MNTLDYITLKAFYIENKEFFEGARLQKIQQPTRRDFVLTIRGKSETRKLYINIDPQVFHICFIDDCTTKRRNIIIPQKPPMFCMLLRKHLEGFRITKVSVPSYERIFEIYFESYNELNEKINLCLAVELMGKYSNVILYNNSSKIIIGCAHNVGSEKSRDRELAGTLPYIYPPKQKKSDILRYFGELFYSNLNSDFMGISKSYEKLFESEHVSLEKIKDYIVMDNIVFTPSISDDNFSVYAELFDNSVLYPSVNAMIDDYFSRNQEKIISKALHLRLQNIVYPRYKKQKNSCMKLKAQIEKKDNAGKYKTFADLIMSNLYIGKDYQKNISVFDWNSNTDIIIPLDKTLSLKENAQKYYNLYSKSKNSRTKLLQLVSESQEYLVYLEQLLYTIEKADSVAVLTEILEECREMGFILKDVTNKKNKDIYIETVVINGFKVYIGKNNKQNDLIISKLSSPDDYWFHTQNCAGSHILLKITDNTLPDEKTLYECCKLAKKYSSASASTKIGVIYTRRKYIKKPPKANLGYVIYKNEQEIIVNEDLS